jgi:hypothetical protein
VTRFFHMNMSNFDMTRGFRRLLLVAGLSAACTGGLIAVAPALATNEGYSCENCEFANGNENFVKNNEAINYTRNGICSIVWKNNGGGNFNPVAEECTGGTYHALACAGGEVKGHGDAEATTGRAHLAGRQDNFSYCG